jgi:hypothetical protein
VRLWPSSSWLEAFDGPGGERAYADRRRLTQCRDYRGDIGFMRCVVIAEDEQYMAGVELDDANAPELPQRLALIRNAVAAMRGPCPAAAQ